MHEVDRIDAALARLRGRNDAFATMRRRHLTQQRIVALHRHERTLAKHARRDAPRPR
jgi:hypothetical protein